MHLTLPESPRALLQDLEAIKRIVDKKHKAGLKAKAKEASASAITKGSSKKCSTSGNPVEQVTKTDKSAKSYQHCKNNGSPHLTHNIKEYCRYEKDGNSVAAAAHKPSDAKKPFKEGATSRWLI
jgi:hypothetical protein